MTVWGVEFLQSRGVSRMILGILSDSHNDVAPVRRALALFDELRVEAIIHCGDVGGQEVFAQFTGRRFWFVWGNTDVLTSGIHAFLMTAGMQTPHAVPLRIELAGKRFAVFHGHEPEFLRAHLKLDVDYILHGHTHVQRDEMLGKCRVINPGALHRAREKTVATLDIPRNILEFHPV